MKCLIFEPNVSGHHLEYMHHYYEGALMRSEEEYIFLVTRDFEMVKDKYEWQTAPNISFVYIDKKYDRKLAVSNMYLLAWNTSIVLRDYVIKIKPDKVLLTVLMQFIPFICWLLPNSVKVRGIMYIIYLYVQEDMSAVRLFAERFRFWVAARSKVIETLFVLNDQESAAEYNRIYHTDKFKYLPDPVPEVDMTTMKDIRERYHIPKPNKMLLHFGGLTKRKGTLDILNAIIASDQQDLRNTTFVFAGKVNSSIFDEFYSLVDSAKKKTQILVFDEFCSYEFLYNLCYSCDVLLMPYHQTNLSSGLLGYASVFNKPVIGPSSGLIGNLIRKYKLGLTTSGCLEEDIKKMIHSNIEPIQSSYGLVNNRKAFIETIFD